MHDTPTLDRDALAGLVFDTLFCPHLKAIDHLGDCLNWSSKLCELIARHVDEADLHKDQCDMAASGIATAATLAGRFAALGQEISTLLHQAYRDQAAENQALRARLGLAPAAGEGRATA